MSVEFMIGEQNRRGIFLEVEDAVREFAGTCSQNESTDERLLRDYVANNDAGAFATIMRRHGGLVSGVCRRVLGREQDVEDAFQATFLVLVRKATSLKKPKLLGNWLYGVAYRVASKIRSAKNRQLTREAPIFDLPAPDANDDKNWHDLRSVLDDEMQRLPQRYRRPIVLFYLEGKSAEEIATTLARPRGTILSQLARARKKLKSRLSRRNLAFSIGVLASLLEQAAAADSTVPDRLLDLGMHSLTASGAGVSSQARLMAQQVVKDMLRHRLWLTGSQILSALLAIWLGILTYYAVHQPAIAVGQSEANTDVDRLQGEWQVVAIVQDGRVLPQDEFPFTSLKIRDDSILHEGGKPHQLKVRFRLHPEQQPKLIDMTSVGYHGDNIDAIYALEGDMLTICRPEEGARPTDFISSPGSKVLFYTAKRIQRPAP
jgi:RNA polymerase sigma factor (sigma-70 family)